MRTSGVSRSQLRSVSGSSRKPRGSGVTGTVLTVIPGVMPASAWLLWPAKAVSGFHRLAQRLTPVLRFAREDGS